MEKHSVLIHISFPTYDFYKDRYLIVVELVNGEARKVHFVNVPHWLVYRSKEYKYHPTNWN